MWHFGKLPKIFHHFCGHRGLYEEGLLNAQWVSKKYFTVGGPFLRIEKGKINANYERLKGKSQKDE